MTIVKTCLIASLVGVCAIVPALSQTSAPPAQAQPDVATLLFGNPQWTKVPAGATLTYSYAKKTNNPLFGPSFDDKIIESIDKSQVTESQVSGNQVSGNQVTERRDVEVKMFSGENAKPAGPFEAQEQNPVLLLVLEENVQELSKLYKANPRYLKNTIRKAWRDEAKIEPVSIEIGGKTMPGTRITITPFTNDPEKDRMLGLEGMTYIVELADDVPGQVATIDIHAPASGQAAFSEVMRYVSEKLP